MLKVRLLNDGGYIGLHNIKFPIVVSVTKIDGNTAWVDLSGFKYFDDLGYPFTIGVECEVIGEE